MTPEEIAYNEGRRAVEAQAAALDELRARSGVLVAGIAVATAFIGPTTVSGGWGVLEVLAGLAFVGVAALLGLILRPREWWFAFSSHALIRDFVDEPQRLPADDILRDLALRYSTNRDRNQSQLDRLSRYFTTAMWLAITVLILLLVGLAASLGK